MRYLLTKKINARESLAGNYLRKQFQPIECDWMKLRSTGRLEDSDFDQAGNKSEIRTEGSRPTPRTLDNVASLLVRKITEREDRRW